MENKIIVKQGKKPKKFEPTGKFPEDSYVPHINFGRNKKTQAEIEAWKQQLVKEEYDKVLKETGSKKKAENMVLISKLIVVNKMIWAYLY